MKHTKKNRFGATFLIFLLLGGTIFIPSHAQASFGKSAINCAKAAAVGAGVSSLGSLVGSVVGGLFGGGGGSSGGSSSDTVPVTDSPTEGSTQTTADQTTASKIWQTTIKGLEDCLVYATGQMMLDELTQNTVSWIKAGNRGGPYYATNVQKLFSDLNSMVAENLANEIQGIQSCNFYPNFNTNLVNSVRAPSLSISVQRLPISCPFPTFNGGDGASAFYNDFSQGGWGAYETSLSDAGNPFGVELATGRKLATRQEEAKQVQQQKLIQGNGFLDVVDTSKCHYPEGVDIELQADTAGPDYLAAMQRTYCETATPAKLVGDQLSLSVGTDQQRLGFADTLSKLISSYVSDQAIKASTGIFKN